VDVNSKISRTYQKLYRDQLTAAIREFHNIINRIKISKQLSEKATIELLTLLAVKFKLRERAVIIKMLFKLFKSKQMRVEFVYNLIKLSRKQKTQRRRAVKQKIDTAVYSHKQSYSLSKRHQSSLAPLLTPRD
jgi:hypothetical protein